MVHYLHADDKFGVWSISAAETVVRANNSENVDNKKEFILKTVETAAALSPENTTSI